MAVILSRPQCIKFHAGNNTMRMHGVYVSVCTDSCHYANHDDVIKLKHFSRYWLFVRGIHRSPVNSPHKGQWSEALVFSLICTQINGWVNNREAGDLRRHRPHYDRYEHRDLKFYKPQTVKMSFPHVGPLKKVHGVPVFNQAVLRY